MVHLCILFALHHFWCYGDQRGIAVLIILITGYRLVLPAPWMVQPKGLSCSKSVQKRWKMCERLWGLKIALLCSPDFSTVSTALPQPMWKISVEKWG